MAGGGGSRHSVVERDFEMAVQAVVETIKGKISQLSIGTYDETADGKIQEANLAHSTITKMLSLINRGTTFSKTNLQSIARRRRRELNILSALATVLGRNGDVVAAVAKLDNGSGDLEVIVTAQLVRGDERPPTTKPGSFGQRVWNVFVNGNVRGDGPRGSLRSTSKLPSIVNPSPPQAGFETIESLKESISRGW